MGEGIAPERSYPRRIVTRLGIQALDVAITGWQHSIATESAILDRARVRGGLQAVDLETILSNSKAANWVPNEVIFKLRPGAPLTNVSAIPRPPLLNPSQCPRKVGIAELDSILSKHGDYAVCRVFGEPSESELDRVLVAKFNRPVDVKALLLQLSRLSLVELVSPNVFYSSCITVPNEELRLYQEQWYLDRIHCPDAWDIERGDASICIAVIDTGVYFQHPDLQGRLQAGIDLVDGISIPGATIAPGQDIFTVDNDPQDGNGHGTAVTGIIAATTNNNIGIAGITWGCKILPVKVAVSAYYGGARTAVTTARLVAQGVVWAVNHGADIINCSLAGTYDEIGLDPSTPFFPFFGWVEELAVAYARRKFVAIVAAMGNSNSNALTYPAIYASRYDNVIAVCGTDRNDRRWIQGAQGSNFNFYACLSAPAQGIFTTVMPGDFNLTGPPPGPPAVPLPEPYHSLDGTSLATAIVSGVAGLVQSCQLNWSPAQIRHNLENTSTRLGSPIPNDQFGFGLINAHAALLDACPPPKPPPDYNPEIDPLQQLVALYVSKGVGVDGGGVIVLPGGGVFPVPPRDPVSRDLLKVLAIRQITEAFSDSTMKQLGAEFQIDLLARAAQVLKESLEI